MLSVVPPGFQNIIKLLLDYDDRLHYEIKIAIIKLPDVLLGSSLRIRIFQRRVPIILIVLPSQLRNLNENSKDQVCDLL